MSWRPAGPCRRLLRECHGVCTGSSRPSRIVLLRASSDALPDELYSRVARQPVSLRYRLTRREIPLQVVSERKDGNYDFTPYLINLA